MAKKQLEVELTTTAIVELPVGKEPHGYTLQYIGVNLTPRQGLALKILTSAASDAGVKTKTRAGERYIEGYACRAVGLMLDQYADQIELPY